MASIVNLPSRGQPIDVSYISQVVTAVNQISSEIGTSSNKYVTIKKNTKSSVKISDTKIFAGYYDIATGATVTAGQEISKDYTFDMNFSTAPIVTATVNNTGSTEGGNAVVSIKNITTSGVTINVKYNTAGSGVTTRINIIAIGD